MGQRLNMKNSRVCISTALLYGSTIKCISKDSYRRVHLPSIWHRQKKYGTYLATFVARMIFSFGPMPATSIERYQSEINSFSHRLLYTKSLSGNMTIFIAVISQNTLRLFNEQLTLTIASMITAKKSVVVINTRVFIWSRI